MLGFLLSKSISLHLISTFFPRLWLSFFSFFFQKISLMEKMHILLLFLPLRSCRLHWDFSFIFFLDRNYVVWLSAIMTFIQNTFIQNISSISNIVPKLQPSLSFVQFASFCLFHFIGDETWMMRYCRLCTWSENELLKFYFFTKNSQRTHKERKLNTVCSAVHSDAAPEK